MPRTRDLAIFVPTTMTMTTTTTTDKLTALPLAHAHGVIKPQCMGEGYGSHFVCVCVSVTVLAATYLVLCPKWGDIQFLVGIVWTLLKTFRSGDMALFVRHDDRQFGSFSMKNRQMVLDTITSSTVFETLARSDDYLNYSDFLWLSWL